MLSQLLSWKVSAYRKPLILKGIRQCGKTWILKEFGRLHYKNIAYFNFDESPEYRQFFQTTKSPERILQNLSIAGGIPIVAGETLIIFDEIQECPEALNSLKYFNENAPEFHVACAGSLLGVALAGASFPVGMVDFLELHPLNFTEYLMADGELSLVEYIRSLQIIDAIPDAFANPLMEKLKIYYVTGGMPEAVHAWTKDRDISRVQKILSSILDAYERDFAKHAEKKDYPKISMIWKSIPSQLARENKKFLYRVIKEGARAREYEDALQWLVNANLSDKIYRITKPGLPLSAYDDLSAFKLYMADVGLLRRSSQLSPVAVTEGNRLFTEFKGALTENYVLQSLKYQYEAPPRYWAIDNPSYEVDFLIQQENFIIPIEVKAEGNTSSKSLKKYKELYPELTTLRVRISMKNLRLDGDLLNIPLYLTDEANRLIQIALQKLIKK
jgi:predicted AAA+ superfamily ATPase